MLREASYESIRSGEYAINCLTGRSKDPIDPLLKVARERCPGPDQFAVERLPVEDGLGGEVIIVGLHRRDGNDLHDLAAPPTSAFIADGSRVTVYAGTRPS